MAKILWRSALAGGAVDALDSISVAGLADGDNALIVTPGTVYHYRYDAASVALESIPDVVAPDDAGTAGRWLVVRSHDGRDTQIANMEAALSAAEDSVTVLDSRVTSVESTANAASTTAAAAQSTANGMDARVTATEGSITALDSRVTSAESTATAASNTAAAAAAAVAASDVGSVAAINMSRMDTDGNLQVPIDEIGFITDGQTFSPLIAVDANATILWTFADGTTSNAVNPTIDYGFAEQRVTRLKVTPWSALKIINLGFAAQDGATTANGLALHPVQPVISVKNLFLAAPSLEHWAACGCDINTLNFDNFVNLQEMEMYGSTGLQHISNHNCPSLYRYCVENTRVRDYVDFRELPALADVRGALCQNYRGPMFPAGSMDNLWHLCVRDNPQFIRDIPWDRMPVLRELLIWNTTRSGAFVPNSDRLTLLQIYNNDFTSIDLSGHTGSGATVQVYNNPNLSTLTIGANTGIRHLDASGCALSTAQIDQILVDLDAGGQINGSCNLSGGTNAQASLATGKAAFDRLVAKGWAMTVALEATPAAVLSATPALLDYGMATAATQLIVTVENTGTLATTPGTATLSNGANFTIITDNVSGAALAPAASATITVEFNGAAGEISETLSIPYDTSSGVAAAPLSVGLSATDTALANRIDFTTTAATANIDVVAAGATVTWHWADGTTTVGENPGTHNFGTSAVRTNNYVTIDPPTALTRINANGATANVSHIYNLPDFPNLNYLYFYLNDDLVYCSVAGLSNMTEFHLNGTSLPPNVVDQILIDADAALTGVLTGSNMHISTLPRTTASDAALASLRAKGMNIPNV